MSRIVARKYALALNTVMNESESEVVLTYLKGVSSLFSDSKFVEVIKSPLVSKAEKAEVILANLTDAPVKFNNFIKLLADEERLNVIPDILLELDIEQSYKQNSFKAFVESNKDLEEAKIEELKATLSKRLGVSLTAEVKNSGYDGVKVEIPDMGLRIDFSENQIKEQMLTHILKAI